MTLDADGTPHLSSAWVGVEDGEIVIGTLHDQRKLRNVRRDPRVALTVQSDVVNQWGLREYLVINGTGPRDGGWGAGAAPAACPDLSRTGRGVPGDAGSAAGIRPPHHARTHLRGRAVEDVAPSAGSAQTAPPPTPGDVAWVAGISAAKAAVVALAIDAFVNSSAPRYSGKAMRIRAIGYTGGMLLVPLAWRVAGRPQPYPRELDLAVTLPLLVDAGGNAIGIYRRAHIDDLIHFADGATLASVAGALATPRVKTSWEAAGVAALAGIAAAGIWEIAEWVGLKLGAKGMDLTYDDTMTDLAETASGALLGAAITLLRHPSRLRKVPGRTGDPVVAGS